MSIEKTIRAQARVKLKKGGLCKPVFAFAIIVIFYMLAEVLANTFYIVFSLISDAYNNETLDSVFDISLNLIFIFTLFLFTPAILGFIKMMYCENDNYELSDSIYFFSSFRLYFKALSFVLSYIVRIIPISLILCIPVAALTVFNTVFENVMSEFAFGLSGAVLKILAILGVWIYSAKYLVAIKILCDNDNLKSGYCFKVSKQVMRGKGKDVCKLTFSFTPWLLLCITVLPILYVLPYFTQAMCLSGKWILELSRNEQGNELF